METKIEMAKRKLWTLCLCGCIGWILFILGCSGIGIGKTFIFIAIIGVLIGAGPSLLSVWQNGFLSSFRTVTVIDITIYSDNRKEENVDIGSTAILRYISLMLTLFIGIFITPIRFVIGVVGLRKAMLEAGYSREEANKAILPPFIACASSYLASILIGCIMAGAITPAVVKNTHPKSELTKEETLALGEKVKAASLLDREDKYKINTDYDVIYYRSQVGNKITYTIEVEKVNKYYYSDNKWYDSDKNEIKENNETKKYSKYFLEDKWDYDLILTNPDIFYITHNEPVETPNIHFKGSYTIGQFRKNKYDISLTVSQVDYSITYLTYEEDTYDFFSYEKK